MWYKLYFLKNNVITTDDEARKITIVKTNYNTNKWQMETITK